MITSLTFKLSCTKEISKPLSMFRIITITLNWYQALYLELAQTYMYMRNFYFVAHVFVLTLHFTTECDLGKTSNFYWFLSKCYMGGCWSGENIQCMHQQNTTVILKITLTKSFPTFDTRFWLSCLVSNALSDGTIHFALHGSFLCHYQIEGWNNCNANQSAWIKNGDSWPRRKTWNAPTLVCPLLIVIQDVLYVQGDFMSFKTQPLGEPELCNLIKFCSELKEVHTWNQNLN